MKKNKKLVYASLALLSSVAGTQTHNVSAAQRVEVGSRVKLDHINGQGRFNIAVALDYIKSLNLPNEFKQSYVDTINGLDKNDADYEAKVNDVLKMADIADSRYTVAQKIDQANLSKEEKAKLLDQINNTTDLVKITEVGSTKLQSLLKSHIKTVVSSVEKQNKLNSQEVKNNSQEVKNNSKEQQNHKKGWEKAKDGRWIWFTGKGQELYNKPGWEKYKGKWLFENINKEYATNEFKKIKGTWYHFRASGYMDSSKWTKVNGKWYYFTKSGKMVSNKTMKIGKHTYKFAKSGKLIKQVS